MRHLKSTTAIDTNAKLMDHIFGNKASKLPLELVQSWEMSDSTGAKFMQRDGYNVLAKSLQAFLDGKFTTHRYLTDRVTNAQDGVATMDQNDCECLRSISSAKTASAKHVMVLRAVRHNVLNADVIQFACGVERAKRPLEKTTIKPQALNKQSNDEEDTVMLVNSTDAKNKHNTQKSRKRRRTKDVGETADDVKST